MKYKFWKSLSGQKKGTILFVHGYATTSEYFDDIAKKLNTNYDYYAVELPGMGITEVNDKELSPISFAYQIIDFIKEQNIEKLYLIGHSMGGGISMLLSYIAPELFKKTVAICPMNSSLNIKLLNAFKITPTKNPKQIFNAQKYIYSDYLKRFPLQDKCSFIVDLFNYQKRIKPNTKKLFKNMCSLNNRNWLNKAEKGIKLPIMLLTAENDMIIDSNAAIKKITKNNPNFSSNVIKDSGHCPFIEKEEETLKVILDFIEK